MKFKIKKIDFKKVTKSKSFEIFKNVLSYIAKFLAVFILLASLLFAFGFEAAIFAALTILILKK